MKLRFDFKPDLRAASPLYVQLAQKLAGAIREGRYQADEALPSRPARASCGSSGCGWRTRW